MSEVIRTGGGRFDPQEQNIYFIASNPESLQHGIEVNHHILIAVNELEANKEMQLFARWVTQPEIRVFLDSGVYNLATTHAHKHGISMDAALSAPPYDVDGFEDLFDRYVSLVRTYGEKLWCYIEIDQGGRENKIKTRTRLEALGLRPTPVYHPLNDGWDYFDYLAERYDRICFGNLVKADSVIRQRLVATAWERHRKYPHLWIHLLGFTANQWLNALPINSSDSSTWLAPTRWPSFPSRCDGASFSQLEKEYRYDLTSEINASSGVWQAKRFSAYGSRMDMLCWRQHMQSLADLGFEIYPAPHGEVKRAAVD